MNEINQIVGQLAIQYFLETVKWMVISNSVLLGDCEINGDISRKNT